MPPSFVHRWLANLRVLEIEEVESVPYAPVSHPFVEWLIGTVRREYPDHAFFWNALDQARKLGEFRDYGNPHRVHRALTGTTPMQRAGAPSPAPAALDHYAWQQHCRELCQTPMAAQLSIRHPQAGGWHAAIAETCWIDRNKEFPYDKDIPYFDPIQP